MEYRIRLMGPWDAIAPDVPLDSRNQPDCWRRVYFPVSWQEIFGSSIGVARFRRNFNAPSNLTGNDRLFLELSTEMGDARNFLLNGQMLKPETHADRLRLEVTPCLQDFNTFMFDLQREVPPSPEHQNLIGSYSSPVVLIIQSPEVPDAG